MKSVQEAPPPPHTTTDHIIARAHRTRTRRRAALGGGALVACLAVAVTVLPRMSPAGTGGAFPAAQPSAPAASFSPPPATPTDAPLPVRKINFGTNLGQYRVGAYQIGPATKVTEGYTELPVYHDGSTWQNQLGEKFPLAVATVTVYADSVYDPGTFGGVGDTQLTIGEPYTVRVKGRKAIGRDWSYGSPQDGGTTVPALAWQWADDSWATFLPSFGGPSMSRDQVARIAAGLTTTTRRDLKVPYRLGYLPKGWQAVSVEQNAAKYGMSDSVVFLHPGPLADPATRVDAVLPGHLVIGVMRKPKPGEKNEHSTEPGVQCSVAAESCSVIHGDYLVTVGGYGNVLSPDQIRQVATELELRDPAQPGSWVKVDF